MTTITRQWSSAVDCSRRDIRVGLVLFAACAITGSVGVGCSVGQGQGELTADVRIEGLCDLDERDYPLAPSFFSGEVTEDQLNLRIQRGSQSEAAADGIIVHVQDVNDVKRQRIGLPIGIDADDRALVQIVLYLNGSCPFGFPQDEFEQNPVILEAVSGVITFRSIYA